MFNTLKMSEDSCIKCKEKSSDSLEHVGKFWKKGSGVKHPVETLIEYATIQGLMTLADELKSHLRSDEPTYIHRSCRTKLRNDSCLKKQGSFLFINTKNR